MPEPDGYKDLTGLAQAIKAAATKAAGDGASALDVNAQIVQAQHDRFLSRVFAEGEESEWLLKGGTAINLFYRDLPRLSVDIDLTYLPIKDRGESLAEINEAMDRMAAAIEGSIAGAKTQRIQGGGGGATRVLARLGGAEIKIETSPVMRGVVHDPEMRPVSDAVADESRASTSTLSF